MNTDYRRIYLVDDDRINNMVNCKLFHRFEESLELVVFKDAHQALGDLQNPDIPLPDAIVLDINMPLMDGWQFLEEYARLQLGIKVVILSSSIDYRDIARSRTIEEVKAFYSKPLNFGFIREILEVRDVA